MDLDSPRAPHITTRAELLRQGAPTWLIENEVRRGRLVSMHRGIYAAAPLDPHDAGALWRARMAAHLVRGGPASAVSHRAAAALHRLDGFRDAPYDFEDLIVPTSKHGFRPAIRTGLLEPADVTERHGLRVTTLARTLADLGRFCDVDLVELALESALRSPDPGRPHAWDEVLLAELVLRAAARGGARTGVATLRAALARRPPGARPTGSIIETLGVQALRPRGLGDLERQPMICIYASNGQLERRAYPDLADLDVLFGVELDSMQAHGTSAALDRDLRRQNDLSEVLTIVRFSATHVLRDPRNVADVALARWRQCRPDAVHDTFHMVRTPAGLDLYRRV